MTATLETPQHLEALDRANQLRFAQTDLLRDLSSNKVSLEVLLADERAASLKFERVLAAMAHRSDAVSAGVIRQSRGTARKIAKAAKVSLTREVGSLRCELTKEVLLACAYDVVGQFAWVYETDVPPKLRQRRIVSTPDAEAIAQRDAALAKGNAIRIRRKVIKEQLRTGEMTLAEALEDPASATWAIGKLVAQVPRTDPETGLPTGHCSSAKTHMALKRLRISPLTKVEDLHPVRRETMLAELTRVLTLGQSTTIKATA